MKQFAGSYLLAFFNRRSAIRRPRSVISRVFFLLPARVGTGSFDNRNELDWKQHGFDCRCAEHLEARVNWLLLLCTKHPRCGRIPRFSEVFPSCRPPAFPGLIHRRDMLCLLRSSLAARPAPIALWFVEAGLVPD